MMSKTSFFSPTPWDNGILGMPSFEVLRMDEASLQASCVQAGHYTIKVDPLVDKRLLNQYGYYYTDTLIEPYCSRQNFQAQYHGKVSVVEAFELSQVLPMCEDSFLHGRFHRDFHVSNVQADQRYKQWLTQLYNEGCVLGLCYDDVLAGFIAYHKGNLLLHTIAPEFRGKGLGKYFWSTALDDIFASGCEEISSSISASNLAILNLYASLGFRFRNSVDVYHHVTEVRNVD